MVVSEPLQSKTAIKNVTHKIIIKTTNSVRPYPKSESRKLVRTKRKRGKTRILTSTSEKRLIKLKKQERQKNK